MSFASIGYCQWEEMGQGFWLEKGKCLQEMFSPHGKEDYEDSSCVAFVPYRKDTYEGKRMGKRVLGNITLLKHLQATYWAEKV